MARQSLVNLETALWVARLGSFSATARQMNATQPAVSLRIRELESSLGAPLFERRGRRMEPTVRGREFLQRMEPLIEGVQTALSDFDEPAAATGVVRIGSGDIPMMWTGALLRELQQQMPRVTFELQIGIAGRLLAQLDEGRLDLAVVAGRHVAPTLARTPIGHTPMLWVAARNRWAMHGSGSAAPPSRLALIDCGPVWLIPRTSRYFAQRIAELKAVGAHLRNVSTCDNMATQIDLVAHGGGIGYLPEALIRRRLDAGELEPLFPERPAVHAHYAMVYDESRLQPVVRRIVELVQRRHADGGEARLGDA